MTLILEAETLRYIFLLTSILILGCGFAFANSGRRGFAIASLILVSVMYLSAAFRRPSINSDTLAYCDYFEMARNLKIWEFLLLVRLEPISAVIIWLLSHMFSSETSIFFSLASIIVICQFLQLRRMEGQYAFFIAATFPQFGFIMSSAIIRWAVAINIFLVIWLYINPMASGKRRIRLLNGALLHYSLIPMAAIGFATRFWIKLVITIFFILAIIKWGPTDFVTSGTGLRLLVTGVCVVFLVATSRLRINSPTDREFLELVALAMVLSILFFISPVMVRFANSVIFIAFGTLCCRRSGHRRFDVVAALLFLLPACLSLVNEFLHPSTIAFELGKLQT